MQLFTTQGVWFAGRHDPLDRTTPHQPPAPSSILHSNVVRCAVMLRESSGHGIMLRCADFSLGYPVSRTFAPVISFGNQNFTGPLRSCSTLRGRHRGRRWDGPWIPPFLTRWPPQCRCRFTSSHQSSVEHSHTIAGQERALPPSPPSPTFLGTEEAVGWIQIASTTEPGLGGPACLHGQHLISGL